MTGTERRRTNPEAAALGPIEAEQVTATIDDIFFAEGPNVLELMCTVGETLVGNLFGGDLDAWHHSAGGALAIAHVAAGLRRRGSDWTSVRLHRAVRVYEQHLFFGGFGEWSHLPPSHFIEVQGLAFEQQRKLLTMAQQEKWDLQQLRAGIDTLRSRANKAVKQAALNASCELLEALAKLLDEESLETNLGNAGVPREEFERFELAFEAFHAEIDSLRDRLGAATRK